MKNKTFLLKLFLTCSLMLVALTIFAGAAVHGDINASGAADAADARLALRASVNLESFEKGSAAFKAGDVDNDNDIDASDARLILRYSVKLQDLPHRYDGWVQEKQSNGVATGKHYRVCICGNRETAACSFGDRIYTSANKTPTCTKGAEYYTQCTACGGKKGGGLPALGHQKGKTLTDKCVAATCTKAGVNWYKCSRCSVDFSETVKALGHKPDIKAPTCIQQQKCTVCKAVLKDFAAHIPGPTATCLENQVCTVCKKVLDTAKGHDMSGTPKASCTTDQICPKCHEPAVYAHHTDNNGDYICDKCGKEMKLDRFNDRVNVLKDGTHSAMGFAHANTATVINDKAMKYDLGFKLLINSMPKDIADEFPSEDEMLDMFCEGFNENTDNYTLYSLVGRTLTKDGFNIPGSDKVSELVDRDIAEITEETVNGIDFLNTLGDTVKIAGTNYSLARYKNAEIGQVIKTTVKLKEEKYTAIKDQQNPTALMRLDGANLRELVEATVGNFAYEEDDPSGELGGAMGMNMDASCKEAISNATVIYYFDAETGLPIAAKYTSKFAMNDYISMAMVVLGAEAIEGHVDFTTNITNEEYYFFDDYFPM